MPRVTSAVVRVDAGPSSLDVVEPFGTTEGSSLSAQVQDADHVQSVPGAGADGVLASHPMFDWTI